MFVLRQALYTIVSDAWRFASNVESRIRDLSGYSRAESVVRRMASSGAVCSTAERAILLLGSGIPVLARVGNESVVARVYTSDVLILSVCV